MNLNKHYKKKIREYIKMFAQNHLINREMDWVDFKYFWSLFVLNLAIYGGIKNCNSHILFWESKWLPIAKLIGIDITNYKIPKEP